MSKRSFSFRLPSDRSLAWGLGVLSVVAGSILLTILVFLALESYPAFASIGIFRFFFDSGWHPLEGQFNLLPMLVGSLMVCAGSVLVATPIGILSAIFCNYYAPVWLASCYRAVIELLAGIPSVVYGLWGLVILVPIIASLHPPGPSLISAVLILSIMILPIVTLVTDASFSAVPETLLRQSQALGLSKARIIWHIVLPSTRSGILTGVLLESGRSLGETMAVLMVAGNVVQLPSSLFSPIRTLTANIALEMAYALNGHLSSLFVCGLLLTVVVGLLVLASELVNQRASL